MIVARYKDEALTELLKNKHDMSLFDNVCVYAPCDLCYNTNCNHKNNSSSINEQDTCDKRDTDFTFKFRDCEFQVFTRCDFVEVTAYRITQTSGLKNSSGRCSKLEYECVLADSLPIFLSEFLSDVKFNFTDVYQYVSLAKHIDRQQYVRLARQEK